MILRPCQSDDARGCFDLFRLAIHGGTAPFYTAEQRAAWAGSGPMTAQWTARITAMHTTIAEDAGAIVGFMSLRADGYLDFAFVHPDHRRSGLAARLLDSTIDHARAIGLARLTTEASHPARRFFLKHGWQQDAAQTVIRRGVTLENFAMSRAL